MNDRHSLLLRVLVSLVVTVVFCIIFLSLQQPYVASVAFRRTFEDDKNTSYFDLNDDGGSERILLAKPSKGMTSLVVYDDKGNILDQYNLRGRYVRRSKIFCGDFDGDRLSELYIFTYMGDSLYLNVLNVYNRSNPVSMVRYQISAN